MTILPWRTLCFAKTTSGWKRTSSRIRRQVLRPIFDREGLIDDRIIRETPARAVTSSQVRFTNCWPSRFIPNAGSADSGRTSNPENSAGGEISENK
jgi:hypothetical protein